MYICPVCNHTSETPTNFCSKCGSAMIEKAPEPVYTAPPTMPEPPAYSAPQAMPTYEPQPQPAYNYQAQPTYNYQPVSYQEPQKKVPLGKVIAGMAIGIAGFVFAILTLIYSFIFIDIEPEMALVFAIYLGGIFALPLSIVGFILSKGAINQGCESGMAKTGKGLGLAGLITSAVSIGLTLILAMAEM